MFRTIFGCAAALAMVTATAAAAPPAEAPIVQTADGKLQGAPVKGIYQYLGVPYGADTGGKNRFLPPQPVAPWTGVRQAVAFGPQCAHQEPTIPGDMNDVLIYSKLPMSEDCLTLNVWTPQASAAKRRPVMFYLHGGGFFMGSSSDRYYNGANLARGNDVVVVTINHRLSLFGYSQFGPEAGPAYAQSGAAGMLDAVQALRWVRANIAKFGGDPDNVTIFGQSGGGMKVSLLMAMPSAKGLFAKAIIQSGPGIRAATPEQAQATTGRLLAKLNLTARDMDKLQAIPAETLLQTSYAAGVGMMSNPVMGNDAIPRHPFDPGAPEQSANIPLMIGAMHDEASGAMLTDRSTRTMDDAMLVKRVTAIVGAEEAPKVIALYKAAAPSDPPMFIWSSIATDSGFTDGTYVLADRKSQQSAPVYVYRDDWRSPIMGGIIRAMHASDLPFVWDNVDIAETLVGSGPRQDKMAKAMSRTWAAFARTGDPNTAGVLPHWPRWTHARQPVMIFDDQPKVVYNPDADKRAYWAAFKARKMAGG